MTHKLMRIAGHAFGVSCVDISPDGRALLAVGCDPQGRQLIVLWDIAAVQSGGKCKYMAKHICDYNVRACKFSAFEEDNFMTCGKDSIRMYRLKGGKVHGMSVGLANGNEKVRVAPWPLKSGCTCSYSWIRLI